MSAFDPASTYVQFYPDGSSRSIPVGPDFWATIATRSDLDPGRLLMVLDLAGDWPTWEIHPAGDEVVMLLQGSATFILDLPEGHRRIPMEAGQAVRVPKGTWHTADQPGPCRMLFLTPGEGTVNKAR